MNEFSLTHTPSTVTPAALCDDRVEWSSVSPRGALDAESAIPVILEGGPANLPAELRRHRVASSVKKIKIRHYGGYEHFECDHPEAAGGLPVVFQWTGRTWIAE